MNYIKFWLADQQNGCFSPMYLDVFTTDTNSVYATVEQYFFIQKALYYGCKDIANQMFKTSSTFELHRLDSQIDTSGKIGWEGIQDSIMFKGYQQRLQHSTELCDVLNDMKKAGRWNKESVFVYASLYDKYWGIARDINSYVCDDPSTWGGQNKLGYIVTKAVNEKMLQL